MFIFPERRDIHSKCFYYRIVAFLNLVQLHNLKRPFSILTSLKFGMHLSGQEKSVSAHRRGHGLCSALHDVVRFVRWALGVTAVGPGSAPSRA